MESIEEKRLEFEKAASEREYQLKLKELEIKQLEVKERIQSNEKSLRAISPVTATILVACIGFLGTAIGTYFQGENTNKLERDKFDYTSQQEKIKFQSNLINKALEAPLQEDRIKSLTFLTKLQLIEDTLLAKRIDAFVKETPEAIPYYVNPATTIFEQIPEKRSVENTNLFKTCVISANKSVEVNRIVDKLIANKSRYVNVCKGTAVPWQFVAVVHYAEGNINFDRHLHNGDPLTGRTVNIPTGRPLRGNPPFTWEESVRDMLEYDKITVKINWSTPATLYKLLLFNGLGYDKQGINSPYLWSGSNHYKKGQYVADGRFDPEKVFQSIGVAVLLKAMEQRGLYSFEENKKGDKDK